MKIRPHFFLSVLTAVLCWQGAGILSARAADVSVSASLSQPEITSGEMAELQIKVTGADRADVPEQIAVDGLQIRLTGQSTQVQMVNFKISSSVVYSYVVMPLRTGNFTIPTIPIRTTAGLARTSPLSFSVSDSGPPPQAQSQRANPGMPGFAPPQQQPLPRDAQPDLDHIAFGEITCQKKTFFVGEMVPVEIRYYFDARYSAQVRSGVNFGSEGIIVERFPEPKESRVEREGVIYNVLSFHTLLSAVQPGSLDIPSAKLETQIQMPGPLPPGFNDPVFQQLLGGRAGFNQTRDVTVNTAPIHLEVIPLPKEGKPASFAGAVGQFDIDSNVANPKPAPGDPVTMTVKIAGKGNFTSMSAPQLTNLEGWRSYPPSEKFEGHNEMSFAGVKSFDFTLIAQQPCHQSPGAEFSYFDPSVKKYVTLTTAPIPLEASPGAASPAPVAVTSSTPPPQQGSTPHPALTGTSDGETPLRASSLRSWQTPMQRSEFFIASLSLLVATLSLAGILHFFKIQSEGGTPSSRRRRHTADLWSALNSGSLDAGATYETALEYAELVPADEDKRREIVAKLTERRNVLKYGIGGSAPLAESERNRLMETLRDLSSKSSKP